jgi:hypothetical protein
MTKNRLHHQVQTLGLLYLERWDVSHCCCCRCRCIRECTPLILQEWIQEIDVWRPPNEALIFETANLLNSLLHCLRWDDANSAFVALGERMHDL